jgi:hypothetical protein
MTPEPTSNSSHSSRIQTPTDKGSAAWLEDTLQLASCPELEWIIVKTSRSLYDVVVLSGESGLVLIRGGDLFPEFRRATLTGARLGGVAVKLGAIVVGLRLEFVVDGIPVVTSRVQAISRHHLAIAEGRA